MARMANDRAGAVDVRAGLPLALVSATSFALSGSLARGLIDAGWSAGAVVLARIAIAALVVAPFARGRCAGAGGCCGATRVSSSCTARCRWPGRRSRTSPPSR